MTRTYDELKADIFAAAMSGRRVHVVLETGKDPAEGSAVWQLVDDGFLTAYASRHCPDGHSMWGNRHVTLASFLEDQPRRPRRCRECPAEGGHDLHAEEDLDDTVQFTCTDKVPAPPTAAELQTQLAASLADRKDMVDTLVAVYEKLGLREGEVPGEKLVSDTVRDRVNEVVAENAALKAQVAAMVAEMERCPEGHTLPPPAESNCTCGVCRLCR